MIGRLNGFLLETTAEDALIDVAGVGYVVRCGSKTLSHLPEIGEAVVLHIESQTREDGTRLFGFLKKDDRLSFTTLLGVQGVGPKAALAILDLFSPQDLVTAILKDDKGAIARATGVGPRLAQRIVTELKDKPLLRTSFQAQTSQSQGLQNQTSPIQDLADFSTHASTHLVRQEAVAALIGLGITEVTARRSIEIALGNSQAPLDLGQIIKQALKEIGR